MKLVCAPILTFSALFVHVASAQNYTSTYGVNLPQTTYTSIDANEVNLSNGGREIYGPSLSIGDANQGGITYKPVIAGFAIESHFPDQTGGICPNCYMSGFIGSSNQTSQLTFRSHVASVTTASGLARFWTNTSGSFTGFAEYNPVIGRTLTYSSTALTKNMTFDRATYATLKFSETFQDSDGTQYIFTDPGQSGATTYPTCELLGTPACSYSLPISRIIKLNGDTLDYYYFVASGLSAYPGTSFTLLSIVSNRGYMIKFQSPGVVAINLAVDACSPIAVCTLKHTWPSISYSVAPSPNLAPVPLTITDSDGNVTQVSHPAVAQGVPQEIIAVTRPSGRVETYTYDTNYVGDNKSYPASCVAISTANNNLPFDYACPFQHLLAYDDGSDTWNYATTWGNGGSWITSTIQRTDPFGNKRTTVSIPSGQIVSDTDELGHQTKISTIAPYQPNEGRILSITYPEGNSKSFNNYDARGNVWQEVDAPKPGSTLAKRTTNYVYPTTCSNWKTCNKPTSVTDPNGNVSSFTYDSNSGGTLTATLPADANGIHPVKRSVYTAMYAWVSNGSGGYTQGASELYLLTQTRTCMTTVTVSNACQGGSADEVVTNYYYGPAAGPNNLSLRGLSVIASGATHTTCYGYDVLGNKISETKPKAGIATCP